MKNLAIIPAREGSKRVRKKNIKSFHGQPLITWVINTALETSLFEDVIVSTDSEEIADLSRGSGASVPFLRPKELSCDETPLIDVIRHAIIKTSNEYSPNDNLTLLYATAPFLTAKYLKQSIEKLRSFDFAVSVCSYPHPIQRALKMNIKSQNLTMNNQEEYFTRSQDLPEMLHDAGQFVSGKIGAWKKTTPFLSASTTGVRLPHYLVEDIDSEEDWKGAEIKFQLLKTKQGF